MRDLKIQRNIREKKIKEIQDKYNSSSEKTKKSKKRNSIKDRMNEILTTIQENKRKIAESSSGDEPAQRVRKKRILNIVRNPETADKLRRNKEIKNGGFTSTIGDILRAKGINLSLSEENDESKDEKEKSGEEGVV